MAHVFPWFWISLNVEILIIIWIIRDWWETTWSNNNYKPWEYTKFCVENFNNLIWNKKILRENAKKNYSEKYALNECKKCFLNRKLWFSHVCILRTCFKQYFFNPMFSQKCCTVWLQPSTCFSHIAIKHSNYPKQWTKWYVSNWK